MASASSGLKSTSINGVKMYSLSGQRSLPSWLPPKKLKSLRKEKAYMRRIDMLQDLGFETASTRIKATPDGEFIIASGIYPPQIKVYEVRELSLKFERHLISEIINFQILSDDYSKLAFLCSDRSVCLHAKYGSHYSLRIPRMGRDIAYDCWSCDLLCAASSPDLYRINLEQGRFLSPFNTQSPAISVVRRSSFHGLVACGGEDGAVECFDTRVKLSVGRINAVGSTNDVDQEVTALQFDDIGGYLMAVGSSSGKVLIYDLRSSHPIKVKDHMYGSPIIDIKWHQTPNSSRANLITTDNHIVRIWDPDTGNGMTSVEPSGGAINDVCVYPESGLMLLALDCSQIPSYFIPTLGPAPKWIPYLENMTEELEEGPETTIYDDYKFLTKEELERLNLINLIGTNLLRAYMHGYFINYRLYKKAQSLSDPFAYDVYIEQKKKEKIEAERASRITIKRKLPKVNRFLASKLLDNEEGQTEEVNDDSKTIKKSKKRKGLTSDVLKDERFTAMFEDKDFEVDEKSAEYLALHPIASQKQRPTLIEEHFKPVEEEDTDQSVSDSDISPSSEDELVKDTNKGIKKSSRVPRLYEIKDERHAEAFWNSVSLAKEGTLTLEERVTALEAQQDPGLLNGVKFGPGGSREISFSSRSSTKFKGDDEDEPKRGKRRGIQSLGLKSDRPKFRGKFHAHRGKG